MSITILLAICVFVNVDSLYEYKFLHTAIPPTVEIQNKLTGEAWEDGYVPRWYKIKSPSYDNEWFRWKRRFLHLSILVRNWLQDGIDVKDFAIAAKYYRGGIIWPEPPPKRSELEIISVFMELLFMKEVKP